MNKPWLSWGVVAALGALVLGLWQREATARRLSAGGSLSLNRASPEALQTLPGIGPVLAERIIAARPFGRVQDLLEVEGVGEATFSALAPLVRR